MHKILSGYYVAIIALTLGFHFFVTVNAQEETNLSKTLPRYLGVYVMNIYGKKPKGLNQIKSFYITEFPGQDIDNPKTDEQERTFIDGELETENGTIYKFRNSFLKKGADGEYEYFEFKTGEVNGISFAFQGKFLEREVKEVENGSHTKVRGILSKYKNNKKIASADVPFAEFAIL